MYETDQLRAHDCQTGQARSFRLLQRDGQAFHLKTRGSPKVLRPEGCLQ